MEITSSLIDSCDLVIVKGRIDSSSAPELSDELGLITSNNRYKIILDMRDVIFISSAGLRVFINFQKICKKNHPVGIVMVNTPTRVYETLEIAGFAPLFKYYNDIASAIDAF